MKLPSSLPSAVRAFWALDAFKPDIALSRDESSRFLPWIIALMVYLAALTLAGGFTLHRTVTAGHEAEQESFSVHLPHAGENAQALTEKTLAILKNTPNVAETNVVTNAHIKELVEPWLGKSEAINNLPLPIIIEVKTVPNHDVDFSLLKARLQAVTPSVEIDDHKQWLAQFSEFVHAVQWVLFIISLFIIGATAAVVIFACKNIAQNSSRHGQSAAPARCNG